MSAATLVAVMALRIGALPEMPPPTFAGLASWYGYPGDRWAGGDRRACRRAMGGGPAFERALLSGVAHRTLPCGTRLLLRNASTGRWTAARVVDRGPYGAVLSNGRWVVKLREGDPGEWRGVLDLLPGVADRLGAHGLHRVQAWVVP